MCGVLANIMKTIIFIKTKAKIKEIEPQSSSDIFNSINYRQNGAATIGQHVPGYQPAPGTMLGFEPKHN